MGSLLHSPLGFDLTVTSLLGTLASGGWLEIVDEDPSGGPGALIEALEQGDALGLLKLTPSHLRLLSGVELQRRVEQIVVGGEALVEADLRGWTGSDTRFCNEYGPTEAVVGCCTFTTTAAEAIAGAVPIGRPIPGARMYLLDDGLQLVPVGVAGQIYIGGESLARGYRSRPSLTADRFVPDPFALEPGARMYRTGDLARYRADGTIEFLGRQDRQIKLRGHRIELARSKP